MKNVEFGERTTEAFAGIGIEVDPATMQFSEEEWHGDLIACDVTNTIRLTATNRDFVYSAVNVELKDYSGLNGLIVNRNGVLSLGRAGTTYVNITSTPHGVNSAMRELGFTPGVDCIERAFVPNYKQRETRFTAQQVVRGYAQGKQIIAPIHATRFRHDISQGDVHEPSRQAVSPDVFRRKVARARAITGQDQAAERLFTGGIDGWGVVTEGLYVSLGEGKLDFLKDLNLDVDDLNHATLGGLKAAIAVGAIPEGLNAPEQEAAYRALEQNIAVHLADLFSRTEQLRPNPNLTKVERAALLKFWGNVIESYGDNQLAA